MVSSSNVNEECSPPAVITEDNGPSSTREYSYKQYFPPLFLGAIVGLGSALTGTSGPLLFIPTMMMLRPDTSPSLAVALAQTVGVPMAIAMTCGTVIHGTSDIDLGLSLIVAISTSLCVPMGKYGLQRLCDSMAVEETANRIITGVISVMIIATGLYIVIKELILA
jgi:uncharacterized membrane protein YfcA